MTLVSDILQHAVEAYPNECCGLVVASGNRHRLVKARNLATSPQTTFDLDPDAWLEVSDGEDVVGIYHSHPNHVAEPSMADLAGCELSGLPWHIVSYPNEDYRLVEPSGFQTPYLGRPYVHGLLDCYAVVRDWFAREWNLTLTNYRRPDYWWEVDGQNLYMDNFGSEGFVRVSDEASHERGDVFLIQMHSKVANHAMVCLGDGTVLHHVMGRLSSVDVFGGYWQKHCVAHLRHNSKMGSTSHG
jgi:proteasome lid subunit RPN8/RPN11